MMTLKKFSAGIKEIPMSTAWYLADLSEALGKQELFTRQSPQKLKALREHALIESAISSNRIEGVIIDQSRVGAVFGKRALRDRDEEEVRGYRDALKAIHEDGLTLPVSERNIMILHKWSQTGGDAGTYKQGDSDIIEKYPDGRARVRFKTVTAVRTPEFMREMIGLWNAYLINLDHPMGCSEYRRGMIELWNEVPYNQRIHPLIAMTAMNLDFLCIHPFRDGNGRVSRLLLLLQCYHLGYEVGRYISLERLIEENKDRYYETLEQSSQAWHEGKHDPWPYINYILFILKSAYHEFEERVGQTASPRGAKAEIVLKAIRSQIGDFRLVDIERACPGVGREWIRTLLNSLKKSGQVAVRGKGPAARWRFRGEEDDSGGSTS
jgi:Fic family protein